jgi:hypothetical protein
MFRLFSKKKTRLSRADFVMLMLSFQQKMAANLVESAQRCFQPKIDAKILQVECEILSLCILSRVFLLALQDNNLDIRNTIYVEYCHHRNFDNDTAERFLVYLDMRCKQYYDAFNAFAKDPTGGVLIGGIVANGLKGCQNNELELSIMNMLAASFLFINNFKSTLGFVVGLKKKYDLSETIAKSSEPWPTIPSGHNPNEGKCGWHFAQGHKEQSLHRSQHYIFVHEVLCDLFFDEPHNIIAILMADKANDSLLDLWHRVKKVFKDLTPSSPDGLACEVRTLKDDTVVVLITLPPPQKMCEAHLVALVYRSASAKHEGITRFIVLEHDSSPMLCEWENVDTHCNMGYRCELNLESFFEVVRELVSLDGLIWPLRIWSGITLYCRKWKIKQILKRIFTPQVTKKDEGFSKIAEQIAERHNKHGATLTDPRTGKDLLAGMTDEQREKFRQFKIKNR